MKIALVNYALIRDNMPRGTMKELAAKMGMNPVTLSRKLSSKREDKYTRKLSVDELNMIAIHLGVGVDEFLRVEDVEPDRFSVDNQ